MKNRTIFSLLIFLAIFLIFNCKKEPSNFKWFYNPTYVTLDIPSNFPEMDIPEDNPMTKEGIKLGRNLFYDKKLSGDNTMSCGSCHQPSSGFSDSNRFSTGIDGLKGNRQSMPLMNLGWSNRFFWDGRALSLEKQILEPVKNPIELHESWKNVVSKLSNSGQYKNMFKEAFGTEDIDSLRAAKAIAQFLRTMISGNSRFDKYRRNEIVLTTQEKAGLTLFITEGADCFHCHSLDLFTDFSFQNNGLNNSHTDSGFGGVTNNSSDVGKFKVPTLRNIVFTAPFMHDGKFNTIDEVINFYSSGVKAASPNISPNMKFASSGGVQLTLTEKANLKAFLLTLTDSSFITNPAFQDPNP